MLKVTIQLIAVALLCSACASQNTEDDTAAAATKVDTTVTTVASTGNPYDVICEDEDVTGSRFTKKTCMTRRERDARAAQAQADLKNGIQRSLTMNPNGVGGG